jgi:hypothetical protein
MNGNFLESLGLSAADANNPRNFLRLNKSIEKAFDEKRLTFLKTPYTFLLFLYFNSSQS